LTPIHIAAAWGRYDILKLLLDCGGDPEIRDLNKKTALHYAVEEEYLDCYKLLKLYVTDKASIIFREKEDCINYALLLGKRRLCNGAIRAKGQRRLVSMLIQRASKIRNSFILIWIIK
jgi:ankyrin repeat protein